MLCPGPEHFEHALHTGVVTEAAFHDPSYGSWDSFRDQWQDIANSFPIPPRARQHDCRIPVTARLVWERDGVELLDTTAYAWCGRLVLVEVLDRRQRTHGAWLHVSDVHRRRPTSPGRNPANLAT